MRLLYVAAMLKIRDTKFGASAHTYNLVSWGTHEFHRWLHDNKLLISRTTWNGKLR